MRYVRAFGVRVLAAALLALVGATAASAQTGTVSGTIRNAANGALLGGVSVQVLTTSGSVVVTSPFTTGTGTYATPPVAAGTYIISTSSGIGFVNKVHNGALPGPNATDVDCFINCSPQAVGTLVTVPSSGTVVVDFALTPGGGITGMITSTAGGPIANVQVQLAGVGSTFFGRSTTTNASGVYTFGGVAAGSFVIKTFNSLGFLDQIRAGTVGTPANIPCFGCAFALGTPLMVPANTGTAPATNVTGIDFALDPGGFISGMIDTTPDPPLGASVTLYNSAGLSTGLSFSADASGNYKTSGLVPGTYFLRAQGTSIHVGRIAVVGNPLGIPCVGCNFMSATALAAIIQTGSPLVIDTPTAVVAAGSIEAAAVTQLTVNLTLPTGGTIKGQVLSGGLPVVGVNVAAYTPGGTQVTNTGGAATTDATGNYTVGPLETGSYQVAVTSNGGQNVLEQVFSGKTCVPCFSPTGGDPVAATLGSLTPGINFSLAAGGQITGRVTRSSDGTPISGVGIRVVDQANPNATVRTTTTNATGDYTLTGLPASNYLIGTSATSQGFIDEAFPDVRCVFCSLSSGLPQTLAAGATLTNRDFAMDAGAQITGRITDALTGAPLAILSVNVVPLSGAFGGVGTTTDNNGNYALRGLPDDSYFLRTTAPSSRGYVNAFYGVPSPVVCPQCPTASGTPIVITGAVSQAGKDIALTTGGTISGIVTNAATLVPIAGVTVNVSYTSNANAGSATTDDLGRYTVGGLATGQYYVQTQNANTLGYINQLFLNLVCNLCSTTGGTRVDVTAGSPTNNINFALAGGGSVTGRVTDAGLPGPGNGLADVTVTLFGSGTTIASVKTNSNGDYVINGIPTGRYQAKATSAPGFIEQVYNGRTCLACSSTIGDPIDVTQGTAIVVSGSGGGAGLTTTGINFALVRGTTVSGRVTDAVTGTPIQFVNVSFSDGFTTLTNVSTNSAGEYRTPGFPPGITVFAKTTSNSGGYINQLFSGMPCVSCSSSLGTPIVIPAGAATSIIGKDFPLVKGGTIEGKVVKASDGVTAVPSASVSVYTTGGSLAATANVAANGTYVVRGLATDSYFALTSNSSGFVNQVYQNRPCTVCAPTSGDPISVTTGSATIGKDFALTQGGVITGAVTQQGTGTPIAGVSVQVYSNTGSLLSTSTTNSAGVYATTAGLTLGSTYFLKTSNTLGFVDVLYDSTPCIACTVTSGTPVPVPTTTPVTGINFALAQGGQVTGTIRGGTPLTPLASVSVNLLTASGTNVKSTTTNATGLFNFTGIAGGTYFVRSNNSLGFIDQLYSGKPSSAPTGSGTPVAVTAGSTTLNINLDLVVGGRIRGRVTDATTSAPLPNVSVSFFNAAGSSVGTGFTTASGDYVTRGGLPTGDYFVRTSNSLGYIDEVYDNIACLSCTFSGRPVHVTVGADTTDINFGLVMGGRISGTVTGEVTNDPADPHAPLANANVSVFGATGESFGTAITGSNGQFITATGLPTGRYFLKAGTAQGHIPQVFNNKDCPACAALTGDAIDVTAGSTTTNRNFDLKKGGLIGGRVTGPGGVPLIGVNVSIFNNINIGVSGATTDADGNYLIRSGLPPGNYFARANNAQGFVDEVFDNAPLGSFPNQGTAIAVAGTATTPNINFALDTGGRISGRVTEAGTGLPLAGIRINVFDTSSRFVTGTQTDQAGGYLTQSGLPAGNYFVLTNNSQGYIDRLHSGLNCLICEPTSGTAVAVTVNNTTQNIDFVLTPGGRISGNVTATDTGSPIFSAGAFIYTATGAFAGAAGTNGLGNYITNTGLPPGDYFVRTFNLRGFIDELFDNHQCAPCDPLTGEVIRITGPGTITGRNFVLDTGGVVTGYVIDAATSAPISGVTVSLFKQSDGTFVGTSRPTDGNGYWAISLPVGSYTAQVNPVQGYVKPPGTSVTAAPATANIEVDRGSETGGVVFPLMACTPPTLSPTSLATVTRGFSATRTVTATGAGGPFTFSISDGALTPGLTLSADGTITGTPTTLGTANFTVAASAGSGCAGTQTFNQFTCGVSFGATGASFTSTGGNGSLSIVATSADCAWSLGGGAGFVTLSPSGAGSKSVSLQLAPNTSPAPRSTTLTLGSQTFTITQGGTVTAAPFGLIDTPLEGVQNVTGSIGVTGWALDDLAIISVEVWRDPVAPEAAGQQIFIGNAVQVEGARPDVQQQFSTLPFNSRAGWGYLMLTNFLPNQGNGPVKLYVYARDLDGKTTLLGTRTINTSNATATIPFGAIDTPGQGATTSGSAFINFGWTLTPRPKAIPTDGSSIVVFVDGLPIGAVDSYNNPRSDIQALFPNYANTDGAVGFKSLDTTQLADGVHTIAWVATDNQGAAAGIGSRFFTVANGSNLIASSRAAASVARAFRNPNVIARAPDPNAPPPPSAGGLWNAGDDATEIVQRPLDLLELTLGDAACGPFTGHLVVDGKLEPLPFGTSITEGTFRWQPGVGYFGTYRMVFTSGCGVVRLRAVLKP